MPASEEQSQSEMDGLRYERFPLISARQRKEAKTRPIMVMMTAQHPVENDVVAVILAWLPGALKGAQAPSSEEAMAEFERSFEANAQSGRVFLPQELGQAAAELSATKAFKALMRQPGRCWAFGETEGGVASAGQVTPLGMPLIASHPDELRELFQDWASERLSSFALAVEHSYFQQMESDPGAIEARLARELAARKEAAALEAAAGKAKIKAPGGRGL